MNELKFMLCLVGFIVFAGLLGYFMELKMTDPVAKRIEEIKWLDISEDQKAELVKQALEQGGKK